MANGKLDVFIVGTVAAILKKDDADKYPSGVRFLLPKAPSQVSKFDSNIVIEGTEPFLGVPKAAILPGNAKPLFVTQWTLPVMIDAKEPIGDPVDMAFFKLNTGRVLAIDFDPETQFTTHDGNTSDAPTKDTARYVSWVANMIDYSDDHAAVHARYLDDDNVPDDVTVVNFDHGVLSVARVGFDHQFRFINSRTAASFDRTIADALKLSTDLATNEIEIALDGDITIRLDATDLSIVIGSEPLSHFSVAERERPCGVPFFQHEILYQLSDAPLDENEKIVVPVCVNVEAGSKDPDLGRCVPPVFMSAPSVAATLERRANAQSATRALSLHLGVNTFSETFQSTTAMPTPAKLESCVRDALAMQKFADGLGFKSLRGDGKNVLADSHVTCRNLKQSLQDYGQALGSGGFFLLTFSGHGSPTQLGGGGWCLNTDIILYSKLKAFLAEYFSADSRIMVISDCCHAGQMNAAMRGIKEIPYHYAAEFFRQTVVLRTLLEEKVPAEQSPTIYMVFACGEDETINDGGKKDLSPFTKCVIAHPHDPSVKVFEKNLQKCSGKSSHIDRLPAADPAWEAGEPFGMPSAAALFKALLAE
jgi:hypothetical protein